jgi:hypothetical protein
MATKLSYVVDLQALTATAGLQPGVNEMSATTEGQPAQPAGGHEAKEAQPIKTAPELKSKIVLFAAYGIEIGPGTTR